MATKYKEWYSDYNDNGTVDYNINLHKLTLDTLPGDKRPYSLDGVNVLRKILFKYIQVIIYNILGLHSAFMEYRLFVLKTLNITGQTAVLEQYLRDKFQDTYIEVVNTQDIAAISYLWNKYNTEGRSGYEEYLHNKSETGSTENYFFNRDEIYNDVDFIVKIPVSLVSKYQEIAYEVDSLKCIGTLYKFVVI